MSAYFVIELDVQDGPSLAEYEREVTEHVVAAGGRFLARGGDIRPIEGDWNPKRIIIVEFPDVDSIERYYHSAPNQRLKTKRLSGTKGKPARAIAVAGVSSSKTSTEPQEAGVDENGAIVWT